MFRSLMVVDSVDFMHQILFGAMFSVIALILNISKVVFFAWIPMMFDILSWKRVHSKSASFISQYTPDCITSSHSLLQR